MGNLKIVVTRKMLDSDLEYIKTGIEEAVGQQFEFIIPNSYDETGICNVAKEADVFLGPNITEKTIATATNLKLIQIPWTGVDTFDFKAVRGFEVPICNTHSNAEIVAELAIALLLDLLKKVSYHDRKMRLGNWNRDQAPLDLKSASLSGLYACILGYGNIGSRIGKILNAFGTKIIAVDDRVGDGVVENQPEVIKAVSSASWLEAVSEAEVVICALPLTPSTKGMINDNTLKSFKDKAYILNISRAEILLESALYTALKDKKIAGFASDVWWQVPKRGETLSSPSAKFDFSKFENVVFSPHRAGYVEGSLPHLDGAIENIVRLIRKQPLLNQISTIQRY